MTAIGYAKLGRSITLDPNDAGFQGDAEAPNLLYRLARRNPNVKWVIVGRNRGEVELPPNVVNIWAGAEERARAMPPIPPQGYNMPWPVNWTNAPAWWCSEQSGFEDALEATIASFDGMVVHLGQHGTTNISIPESHTSWTQALGNLSEDMTNPQDWSKAYARFLIRGLNALGDRTNGQAPVIWICTDPRNYIKARDLKWHTGVDDVLAQYDWTRQQRHERFRDPRLPTEFGIRNGQVKLDRHGEIWIVKHTYRLAGLELMILPDDWETWGQKPWNERLPAGIASTSFDTRNKEMRRSQMIRDVLLAAYPDAEVWGKWDKKSLEDVPEGTVQQNDPSEFQSILERFRVTLSLPALGSSWTVAKPYQCFAANVVCFMYGRLDDRGWILPSRRRVPGTKKVGEVDGTVFYSVRDDWTDKDLKLARWLRVETAEEFATMSRYVVESGPTWLNLTTAQRDLLHRRWDESFLENTIERKLGLR